MPTIEGLNSNEVRKALKQLNQALGACLRPYKDYSNYTQKWIIRINKSKRLVNINFIIQVTLRKTFDISSCHISQSRIATKERVVFIVATLTTRLKVSLKSKPDFCVYPCVTKRAS